MNSDYLKVGMLWFDNDPRTQLEGKVERAVSYYKDKYKKQPTLVEVNPSSLAGVQLGDSGLVVSGVEVRPSRSIMPNHFWVSVATPVQQQVPV